MKLASNKVQQGMTLLEIMIAMVISLFLLGGVMQIFLSSKQTFNMQENLSRLQENARFAMEFITHDIRMADYWGCMRNGLANVTNNLDTSSADYDPLVHAFSNGITGTEGVAGANAALDSPDSITLKGAYDSGLTIEMPYGPQASSNIKVKSGNDLAQSDVVLIADCSKADIFQISNATPGSGTVVHNTGNATSPGNYNISNPGCPGANAHCLSKVYMGDASLFSLATITYSIQNGASGQLSLFRSFNGTNAEMVEGIENMQILYGEDSNNDNSPDYYVPAGTVGLNMDQVVSIRVSLLIVSPDDNLTSQPISYTYNNATTTPTDNRLRRVFTSTIAVRNRLP